MPFKWAALSSSVFVKATQTECKILFYPGVSAAYADQFGLSRYSELGRAMNRAIADCGRAYERPSTFRYLI